MKDEAETWSRKSRSAWPRVLSICWRPLSIPTDTPTTGRGGCSGVAAAPAAGRARPTSQLHGRSGVSDGCGTAGHAEASAFRWSGGRRAGNGGVCRLPSSPYAHAAPRAETSYFGGVAAGAEGKAGSLARSSESGSSVLQAPVLHSMFPIAELCDRGAARQARRSGPQRQTQTRAIAGAVLRAALAVMRCRHHGLRRRRRACCHRWAGAAASRARCAW